MSPTSKEIAEGKLLTYFIPNQAPIEMILVRHAHAITKFFFDLVQFCKFLFNEPNVASNLEEGTKAVCVIHNRHVPYSKYCEKDARPTKMKS